MLSGMKIVLLLCTNVFRRSDSFLIYVSKILAEAGDDMWHQRGEKLFHLWELKKEKYSLLLLTIQIKLSIGQYERHFKTV